MKILYYSNPYFADADFPLVRSLQQKGSDITYLIELAPYNLHATIFDIKRQIPKSAIIPASEYPELCRFKDYFDLKKVYIVNRTVWKESAIKNLLLSIRVFFFILKRRFDIIHTDFFYTKYLMLLYVFRKKTLITVHDPIPHTGEKDIVLEKYKKIAYKLVNKIILLNDKQTDSFINEYQIPLDKIEFNKLGIYDCLTAYKDESIKPKEKSILFFGRISPYKGLEYLCEAMLSVNRTIPESALTIAGSGAIYFNNFDYQTPFIRWINEFISIDNLVHLIQQADIVVVPYIDATQSGVIMTAHAIGKPVIATAVGGLVDAIEDGKTGVLVKAKSSEELSIAIIDLLQNPKKKEQMISDISKRYLSGIYSWDVICNKYIDIYKRYI